MGNTPQTEFDARPVIDRLMNDAAGRRASDVHFEPTAHGYEARFRIDGLLQVAEKFDAAMGKSLVNRLMVLGKLLTYRLDVPQEGRVQILLPSVGRALELRLAVMPTTHGMRAAVRLPAELIQPRKLEELGLPQKVLGGLLRFARTDAGLLAITGPAGSGKTTTIYALLEKIAELQPGLSIISLEDPVERHLAGVTQIEVSPFGELTYEKALRSILRQDPQVLMLGEIRDAATASLAIQAALSGHRLICTFHAASPAGGIARLYEMGLESYQITSALFGVVAQRLLRRRKQGGGYEGRIPVAEMVIVDAMLRDNILRRADADSLRICYERQADFATMQQEAERLVAAGTTDREEVGRVLGT